VSAQATTEREVRLDSADDRELLAELLATNRELTAVNRKIAESLANLERLYADDVRQRQAFTRQSMKRLGRMAGSSSWHVYWPIILGLVVFALIFALPKLIELFGK
jgi:hypothetical protein